MNKSVYLAGPITGLTLDEGMDWRTKASDYLEGHGITAYSPLRGKDYLKNIGIIEAVGGYTNPLSRPPGIVARDRMDCMSSDLVLFNLSGAQRVSIGSMIEVGWADAARRPIILLCEEGNPHRHDMLLQMASYHVEDLQQALVLILALLLPRMPEEVRP